MHRAGCDIELTAEKRLNPSFFRLFIKLHRPVEYPVIGHGHRRHAAVRDLAHQLGNPNRTIEHGVLGVQVEMDERRRGHVEQIRSTTGTGKRWAENAQNLIT